MVWHKQYYLWVGVIAGLLTGCGVSRLGGDELCNIPDEVHPSIVKYSSRQVLKDLILRIQSHNEGRLEVSVNQ